MIHIVFTIELFAAMEQDGENWQSDLAKLVADPAEQKAFIQTEVAEGNFQVKAVRVQAETSE